MRDCWRGEVAAAGAMLTCDCCFVSQPWHGVCSVLTTVASFVAALARTEQKTDADYSPDDAPELGHGTD